MKGESREEVHALAAAADLAWSAGPIESDAKWIRVSEEVLYTKMFPVSVNEADLEWLRRNVWLTARKRLRLCTHPDVGARLHEMFVCYTRDTQITPHMHRGKDETFFVIEGDMDFVIFNDDRTQRTVLPMGDSRSGKAFCIRVPMDTYHTVRLRSPMCILHEATPGPFVRADTVWADW